MSCERMIGIMTISQNDPRNDHKGVTMYEIKITVNGKEIELSGFPGEIISEAVVAMLKTLRGVEEVKDAVIELKK